MCWFIYYREMWYLLPCSGKQSWNCSETLWTATRLSLIRRVKQTQRLSVCCYGPRRSLLLFPALFRHLKGRELRATCWDWSWRLLKGGWAFPRSSWTRRTAWPHTGNCEQDRCVRLTAFWKVKAGLGWNGKRRDRFLCFGFLFCF